MTLARYAAWETTLSGIAAVVVMHAGMEVLLRAQLDFGG
jgi:hypothetical protein